MNRDELIDEMNWEEKWLADVGYSAYNVSMSFESIKNKIKELEQCSVKPELEWTPTNEAMPTKTGFYLIQYSRKYCHDELAVAYYSVEEKRSDTNYEWEFRPMELEYQEVVAWMPLPKMYHTGREGKYGTI